MTGSGCAAVTAVVRHAESERHVRRSLAELRELGDRGQEAVALNGLADLLEQQGRHAEALELLLDALQMSKAVGQCWTQEMLEQSTGLLYAMMAEYHVPLRSREHLSHPLPRLRAQDVASPQPAGIGGASRTIAGRCSYPTSRSARRSPHTADRRIPVSATADWLTRTRNCRRLRAGLPRPAALCAGQRVNTRRGRP